MVIEQNPIGTPIPQETFQRPISIADRELARRDRIAKRQFFTCQSCRGQVPVLEPHHHQKGVALRNALAQKGGHGVG